MKKSDISKLTAAFTEVALKVKPDEKVFIQFQGKTAKNLALACADKVIELGAMPLLNDVSHDIQDRRMVDWTDAQRKTYRDQMITEMKHTAASIIIYDDFDAAKSNATPAQRQNYQEIVRPYTKDRHKTRWLVVASPTAQFAKACGMKKKDFDGFYVGACSADYTAMEEAVKPLTKIMREGKKVHIKGKDTDLSFSIKDIDAVPCTGEYNVPDGECFTAPVKDSVNGTILYGPSKYSGKSFDSIKLTFKDGKVIDAAGATPAQTKALNDILNMDDGSRYVGEFAIAFNPFIYNPVGDILFDEKIAGSLHLALGECYEEAENGNKSLNHWDMVHIQRPEYGGGEIWIDDTLIRKDGIFVIDELKGLNPDRLAP
jgi:aminopeptidase